MLIGGGAGPPSTVVTEAFEAFGCVSRRERSGQDGGDWDLWGSLKAAFGCWLI